MSGENACFVKEVVHDAIFELGIAKGDAEDVALHESIDLFLYFSNPGLRGMCCCFRCSDADAKIK